MSVTAAAGFVAGGIASGIKASGALDLALVASQDGRPVAAAGVFTSNRAAAAPVLVSRSHLACSGGRAAAVVLNSGNANAATGATGLAKAERMCALVAEKLGSAPHEVLVCSTGLIGFDLASEPIETGVPNVVAALSPQGGGEAARAIMTTDTHPKQVVVPGGGFVVGGMAKGAAMLAPDMATMLAVLTTDAEIAPDRLAELLRGAVGGSFNAMSVDGSNSTNDTVVVLASGRAGVVPEEELADALSRACGDLAAQMAGDAEGMTKVARIRVTGATDDAQAARAARQVAESILVKCSLYGGDPYWGRVVSQLGSAGVDFDIDRVSVAYGGTQVCRGGIAAEHDVEAVATHMAGRYLDLSADLGLGSGQAGMLATDLTHAYIDENMRTS
ncbi:MAG: bifunctional glutamate N-acetyltransferase/amino-acid acetyltransferase ArgJ [Acidimicrobiales bacterium]